VTPKQKLLGFVAVLALGAGSGVLYSRTIAPKPTTKAAAIDCSAQVTKAELEKSIELGQQYMTTHEKAAGNFDYEYDWKAKKNSDDNNEVRQAGAVWGVSLLYAYALRTHKAPELEEGVKRAIAYFDDTSKVTATGGRYPLYRGDAATPTITKSGIGMAALVTLGLIDYARTLPPDAPERKRAFEYGKFLAESVKPDGTWPGDYRYDTGAGVGKNSPYSDGEALLALVTGMKYLGWDEFRPVIEKAAKGGHSINVEKPIAEEPDNTTTKGYYQWSSMALYELATSPMANTGPYGDWLLGLADWIIDVHRIIGKPKNTGYAYEGLVSAYAWAKEAKDPRAEKIRCVIHRGLSTLLGWQVGHPRAAKLGGGDDPKAVGGVQNHSSEPALRIDVVQHQMHAEILAIDHLF
jgi:UDP-N-acetylmuramoyl-tripeptide--D-alanyl-D-alanine ligase